jgi:arsenite-transporting ATPase
MMSFKKITDFMRRSDYQVYLADTAPTGHTLRLLMLPELLDQWIKFLATLRWKYHTMVRHFARQERIEKADELLMELKRTVKRVKSLLQNTEITEFVVVTIAEKMAFSETEDLIRNLEQMKIPSRHMLVNNVFPREECDFVRQRRALQDSYLKAMKEKFPRHSITVALLQPTEVQGIAGLQTLGAQLFSESQEEAF